MEVHERHLSQERKRRLLVLKEAPSDFRMVQVRGTEEWTKSVDDLWVSKTEVESQQKGLRSAGLFFDDGVDSFIVAFQFYPKSPRVIIQQGCDEYNLVDFVTRSRHFGGISDRATCILSSERIVSASSRPEHWRGDPCHALRVSVSKLPE